MHPHYILTNSIKIQSIEVAEVSVTRVECTMSVDFSQLRLCPFGDVKTVFNDGNWKSCDCRDLVLAEFEFLLKYLFSIRSLIHCVHFQYLANFEKIVRNLVSLIAVLKFPIFSFIFKIYVTEKVIFLFKQIESND